MEPKNVHSPSGENKGDNAEENGKENILNYTSKPHKERRHQEENTNKICLTRSEEIKWR